MVTSSALDRLLGCRAFVKCENANPTRAFKIRGAYNKVNLGETYLATDKGTIFVLPNQMGFAGGKDQMPQLQPINTNLFTVAAEPTPQAEGDRQEAKEEGVRETAVVDNTAQEQVAAPTPTTAAPENTVTTTASR